jgi:chromosomal replication initiator protein
VTNTVVELAISGQASSEGNAGGSCLDKESWSGTFLAGPENSLVVEAVNHTLNGGYPIYNPLFFYGLSGVGKTHLAAGMAEAWRKVHGSRDSIYVTAVDFAHQWTDAIEAQATGEFQARYRRAGMVAIDDLHALGDRRAAQEELLHTIDALLGAGSRVVLTAYAAPGELAGLSAALQARLVGGLVVGLAPPGRAVRMAAARKFSGLKGLDLSDEAAAGLADALPESLSAIWAAVNYLEMSATVDPDKPIEERVAEYLASRQAGEPSLREIAVAAARHFSVRLAELRSGSRRRAVVLARDVAMYLARTLTGKSYQQIGAYFCGRDHSTVSHGCAKTAELVKTDPSLRNAVDQLRRRFRVDSGSRDSPSPSPRSPARQPLHLPRVGHSSASAADF